MKGIYIYIFFGGGGVTNIYIDQKDFFSDSVFKINAVKSLDFFPFFTINIIH